MIRVLIVEDELYIRKGIIAQLHLLDKDIVIVGECGSVKDAIALANSSHPDLVFLDINLDDGSAFDFIDKTQELPYKIIFTTAYNQYALQALKKGAVDYILKPINQNELEQAVDKAITEILKEKEWLSHSSLNKDRLVLSLIDGLQVIKLKDLMYCKSDKGYTSFFLSSKKEYLASKSIKNFEKQLISSQFIRVHQSYIVNLDFVDRYDKSGIIHLIDGVEIPVSVSRKDEFLKKLL